MLLPASQATRALLAACVLGASLASAARTRPHDEEPVDYARQVRPLLSDRCFPCHGPDRARLQADLRLDLQESARADRGGHAAVVPGDAAASELVRRIQAVDADERMPPPAANLALAPREVDLLTRWIEEGAVTGQHWAFERPARHAPPATADAAWCRDPLDAFVSAEWVAAGLTPAEPADAATLLRRVTFDLTGLPPTLAQLDAFLADDRPDAYERVVQQLLEGDAHAERLAADWLDVARYADTFGYQSDVEMNVWPWRDWVLAAFRSNLPYDQFVTQQLAGDLLPAATRATRLATTFNRLHRQTNEGGSVEEEFRIHYVADRVETMSAAFLGLTVGCARCHDHKFDPITQRDFYELSSFFDDIDESGLYSHFTNAVPTPALDLPTPQQERALAELEERVRAAEARLAACASLPGRGGAARARYEFEPPDVTANAIVGAAPAQLVDEPETIAGAHGRGLRLSGENAVVCPGVGVFERSNPFTIALAVHLPAYERAVVIHRTKSWTDSGSRGYQLLVEDGRLTVALVHFWPGDALAVRTLEPVDTERWLHVAFTYDGSSRASGLGLYLDGRRQAVEIVRDHLTRTLGGGGIEHLTIGSRFRDKGLAGGGVDDVAVFDRELAPAEVAALARTGSLPAAEPDPVVDALGAELRALRAERDAVRDEVRQIMTMAAAPDLPAARRSTHVLGRGVYDEPGAPVRPAVLSAFPTLGVEQPEDRLDLARWLTDPGHPTTARVHVDRLWRIAFGRGLVRTPEDWGSQAPPPTHRRLLDTLARDLIESGWDSRALLRRFVLSATYRQSSTPSAAALEHDPENEWHTRAVRLRRPAEMVRDGALHAAGLLVARVGGPSVFPYQPPGLWLEKSGRTYPVGRADELRRRSLYTFWRRTSPPPAMTAFDAPAREVCSVARPATVTPHQVLALWNDPQFVEVAVTLGRQAFEAVDLDVERVRWLVRTLTSHGPSAIEERALIELLAAQRKAYRTTPSAARALAEFDLEAFVHPSDTSSEAESEADSDPGPSEPLAAEVAIECAALAVVASTVLGSDAALTRR